MVVLQRHSGSQQRRKNVSDEKNKRQEQGPLRLDQVLLDPRESHFPYGNCGGWWRDVLKMSHARLLASDTCKSAKHIEGNP